MWKRKNLASGTMLKLCLVVRSSAGPQTANSLSALLLNSLSFTRSHNAAIVVLSALNGAILNDCASGCLPSYFNRYNDPMIHVYTSCSWTTYTRTEERYTLVCLMIGILLCCSSLLSMLFYNLRSYAFLVRRSNSLLIAYSELYTYMYVKQICLQS